MRRDAEQANTRWTRTDYARDAVAIARALLGQRLVRVTDDGEQLSGTIIETEAYVGPEDLASHARGGLRTKRNASMWAEPGTAYVYFTYGMHHCFNVSCWKADHPAAVLIRAIRPERGLERMRAHRLAARRGSGVVRDRDLADGPAKLCQALAIGPADDGHDMATSDRLWIAWGEPVHEDAVLTTPRIGIANAGTWTDKPLRCLVR
jgi:DNA-3-methyladenine glycosylase